MGLGCYLRKLALGLYDVKLTPDFFIRTSFPQSSSGHITVLSGHRFSCWTRSFNFIWTSQPYLENLHLCGTFWIIAPTHRNVDTTRTKVCPTRGTRLHILPTRLAHDVPLGTRGDGELTWNLETDRTL